MLLWPQEITLSGRMEGVNFLTVGGVLLLRHSWLKTLTFQDTQFFPKPEMILVLGGL